jgi:hypothetical protein
MRRWNKFVPLPISCRELFWFDERSLEQRHYAIADKPLSRIDDDLRFSCSQTGARPAPSMWCNTFSNQISETIFFSLGKRSPNNCFIFALEMRFNKISFEQTLC